MFTIQRCSGWFFELRKIHPITIYPDRATTKLLGPGKSAPIRQWCGRGAASKYIQKGERSMRRSKVEITSDILRVCRPGICKTKIVYFANLNFKLITPYLEALINAGMIQKIEGQNVRYKTTEKGVDMLNKMDLIRNEIIEPISLAEETCPENTLSN
ncbi:MAG TPA: winged helix-turn-helix domain-containing protein [Methanothrix sp.]|nr:winged helix-turn-helix domain-containing protein [Methanothrix sp.]